MRHALLAHPVFLYTEPASPLAAIGIPPRPGAAAGKMAMQKEHKINKEFAA
jgi:hypothetical protein